MFLISLNPYMGFRTHLPRTHDTFMDTATCECVSIVEQLRWPLLGNLEKGPGQMGPRIHKGIMGPRKVGPKSHV